MTDRFSFERDVDTAIDRAVREIMSAEPHPGFSRRVLRRLNEAPASRWTSPRLTAIGSAAAVLLLLFWLALPFSRRAPDTRLATQPSPATPAATKIEPQRPTAAAGVNSPQPAVAQVDEPALPQPSPGRVEAASILVDTQSPASAVHAGSVSVELPDPIRISPLHMEPLDLPGLSVPALTIDPITIAPLSPPR